MDFPTRLELTTLRDLWVAVLVADCAIAQGFFVPARLLGRMASPEKPARVGDPRPEGFRRFLSRVTSPHPTVQRTPDRRRARLAASIALLLVLLVALSTIFSLWRETVEPRGSTYTVAVELLAIGTLLVGYAFFRSPRPVVGSIVVLFTIAGALWALWVPAERAGQESDLIYFLVLPILLTPLVVRFRVAAALVSVQVVAVAMGHQALHGWNLDAASLLAHQGILFLAAFVGAITILSSYQLEQYLELVDDRERKLRSANEELRKVDTQRLEFVNTIAHDLGSPLTPIKLQVHLLRNADPAPSKGSLDIVDRNVDHLTRLVGDLRDVGKLESGNLKLDKRPANLSTIVTESVASHGPIIAALGIFLDVDQPPSTPVVVDEPRVTQVLTNLLTNAIKFTPAQGRIGIRVEPADGHVRVSVTDSGRGLSSDEMPRLFRPFSQVHERHETKERGTGLGLFICKRLIEQHGGSIGVASPGRGQGSTFWFTLPLAPS